MQRALPVQAAFIGHDFVAVAGMHAVLNVSTFLQHLPWRRHRKVRCVGPSLVTERLDWTYFTSFTEGLDPSEGDAQSLRSVGPWSRSSAV